MMTRPLSSLMHADAGGGTTKKRLGRSLGKNLNKEHQPKLYAPPATTSSTTSSTDQKGLVLLTLTSKRSSSGGLLSSKSRVTTTTTTTATTTSTSKTDDHDAVLKLEKPPPSISPSLEQGSARERDLNFEESSPPKAEGSDWITQNTDGGGGVNLANLAKELVTPAPTTVSDRSPIKKTDRELFRSDDVHDCAWSSSESKTRHDGPVQQPPRARVLWEPSSPMMSTPNKAFHARQQSQQQEQQLAAAAEERSSSPANSQEDGVDEGNAKVVISHLASYEDRRRGGADGARSGPRMLFDPKSGTMMEVKEKTATSSGDNPSKRGKGKGKSGNATKGKSSKEKNTKMRGSSDKKAINKLSENGGNSPQKKKSKGVRPASSRLPRTLGVLFIRDGKSGDVYSADGCLPESGYGSHSVPGGIVRNQKDHVKKGEKVELITGVEQQTLKATASEWAPAFNHQANLMNGEVKGASQPKEQEPSVNTNVEDLLSSLGNLTFDTNTSVLDDIGSPLQNPDSPTNQSGMVKLDKKPVGFNAKNLFSYGQDSPWSATHSDSTSQWTAIPSPGEKHVFPP